MTHRERQTTGNRRRHPDSTENSPGHRESTGAGVVVFLSTRNPLEITHHFPALGVLHWACRGNRGRPVLAMSLSTEKKVESVCSVFCQKKKKLTRG